MIKIYIYCADIVDSAGTESCITAGKTTRIQIIVADLLSCLYKPMIFVPSHEIAQTFFNSYFLTFLDVTQVDVLWSKAALSANRCVAPYILTLTTNCHEPIRVTALPIRKSYFVITERRNIWGNDDGCQLHYFSNVLHYVQVDKMRIQWAQRTG